MCNFNFEAQMKALKRMAERNTPEESSKILQTCGVLNEKGEMASWYKTITEPVHEPAV